MIESMEDYCPLLTMSPSEHLSMAAAVSIPLAGGYLSGYVVRNEYNTWYETIKTPDWKPPRKAFPIVWTALYGGMGYASYLVWKEGNGFDGIAKLPLALYGTQLALNFAWSPIFFGKHSIKGGLITIGLLDAAVAGTAYLFYKVSPAAGYLLVPYLAWLALATALNYQIFKDNPQPPPSTATIREVKDK